jgi:PPK2 family polyphosphate:nucleotide phosphotransferase
VAEISMEQVRGFVAPYRIADGKKFRLADHDPGDSGGFGAELKSESQEILARGVEWLAAEQRKLYAQDRWSLLLIFQAMDAAGKDSTIQHVLSGVNPQGVQVTSFKAPSSEELDHDFLWRCWKALPERGRIGIFNRSYYEEVLVVRVHEELLARQQLPPQLVTKKIWDERLEDIVAVERYLARNGTRILKFFLNVSRAEQKKRCLERIEDPEKRWKFSRRDVEERSHWDAYQEAYEKMIRRTATEDAPWYVVPADRKWFTRLVVAATVVEAMHALDLRHPELDGEQQRDLEAARKLLEREE